MHTKAFCLALICCVLIRPHKHFLPGTVAGTCRLGKVVYAVKAPWGWISAWEKSDMAGIIGCAAHVQASGAVHYFPWSSVDEGG